MSWKFPGYEVGELIDWEAMELRYDWLVDMKGVSQDPVWHAEGDVYVHTKMVVEALIAHPDFQELNEADQHILVAAAFCHDIEKRSTTKTEVIDGVERIVSPKHAKFGEYTSRQIFYKDIPTPFETREKIAKLVRLHGLPIWAIEKPDPRKAVIEASLVVNTRHLALLSESDILGRICDDQDDLLLKVDLFRALCEEHECYGKPRSFESDYGRYLYLSRDNISPDYKPYEDHLFEVTVTCALPGTGKDTYINKHFDLPMVSLDTIRRIHGISPRDKKGTSKVVQLAREESRVLLRGKKSFIFNATNLTRSVRQKWISLFMEYGARVKILYLEVPYRTLIAQNHHREHKVPENVMKKMVRKIELPSFNEAHELTWIIEGKEVK